MPDFYLCELCDIWTEPDYCQTCEKSKCHYCGDCAEDCKDKGEENA